jgi:pimeloyl-ACP methyl ester carboxylesterase
VGSNDHAIVGGMFGWIRSDWEFRATALPSPANGVVGHSFGGGVAAEFVKLNPGGVAAFASLSGQTGEGLAPLANAQIPKLFTFGSDALMDAILLDLNPLPSGPAWAGLPSPKHVAILKDIGHFDYLRAGRVPCEGLRGTCTHTPALAAELLVMFFGRYLRPEGVPDLRPRIPASLIPPKLADLGLTLDQEFYAGGYIGAFEHLTNAGGCGVALAWDAGGGDSGSKDVP